MAIPKAETHYVTTNELVFHAEHDLAFVPKSKDSGLLWCIDCEAPVNNIVRLSEATHPGYDQHADLLSIDDVANMLRISPDMVRRLDIPHVRLGRASRVYFRDEVIRAVRAMERD